ncbi:Ethylene-responsive transcription factor CRF1 [Hordeum vulgare]|nr:Ethylene-responsive transcription factor CRF1 [Hordeum vulgare]
MSPHRWGSSGYRGVHERPSGTFYAEIRSSYMRLVLSTFDTADESAHAYDEAVWHLPRREMNSPEVMTLEWVQRLTPPPRVVTKEDHRQNQRWERRLGITKMDEHAMAAWRQQFPQDVLDECAFFVQRRAQRRAEQAVYRKDRCMQKQAALFNIEVKEASAWDPGDERWADAFITTKESDTSASEEDDEEKFLPFFIISGEFFSSLVEDVLDRDARFQFPD